MIILLYDYIFIWLYYDYSFIKGLMFVVVLKFRSYKEKNNKNTNWIYQLYKSKK